MSVIDRADIDRRSAADRRRVYDLDHFQNGGIERRKGKERRSQTERRDGWIRISSWASLNLQDLKGEYIHAFVDAEDGSDPDFNGYYVMASYFLTGETRSFNTSKGAFSRLKPKKNFRVSAGGI